MNRSNPNQSSAQITNTSEQFRPAVYLYHDEYNGTAPDGSTQKCVRSTLLYGVLSRASGLLVPKSSGSAQNDPQGWNRECSHAYDIASRMSDALIKYGESITEKDNFDLATLWTVATSSMEWSNANISASCKFTTDTNIHQEGRESQSKRNQLNNEIRRLRDNGAQSVEVPPNLIDPVAGPMEMNPAHTTRFTDQRARRGPQLSMVSVESDEGRNVPARHSLVSALSFVSGDGSPDNEYVLVPSPSSQWPAAFGLPPSSVEANSNAAGSEAPSRLPALAEGRGTLTLAGSSPSSPPVGESRTSEGDEMEDELLQQVASSGGVGFGFFYPGQF